MRKLISKAEFSKLVDAIWFEFLENATQLEIHKSVATSNWDDNHYLLNWIKENPKTDKGTILMAYWRSAPRWNKQFLDRDDLLNRQGWGVDSFDFIEDIESRYCEGFYTDANIYFDPKHGVFKDDWTKDYLDIDVIREIPPLMFQPVIGTEVLTEYPNDFDDGLPLSPRNFCKEIYDLFDPYDFND